MLDEAVHVTVICVALVAFAFTLLGALGGVCVLALAEFENPLRFPFTSLAWTR